MGDAHMDALLDRVSDLLKLCTQADDRGRGVVSTTAIRELFGPRDMHPAARLAREARR